MDEELEEKRKEKIRKYFVEYRKKNKEKVKGWKTKYLEKKKKERELENILFVLTT